MHTTKFAAAVLSAQKIPQYKFIPFQGTSPLSARWLRYIQCMLKFDRSTNEIWSINELPAPPLAPSFFVGQSTELSLNPRAIHSGHVFCGRTQLVHVVHDLAHGLPVILEIACSQRKKKKRTMEFYSGKKRGKPLCCVLWVVSVNLHWPNNWHALCWLCVKQRLACWFWWILFVLDFMVFIFWYFFSRTKYPKHFVQYFVF